MAKVNKNIEEPNKLSYESNDDLAEEFKNLIRDISNDVLELTVMEQIAQYSEEIKTGTLELPKQINELETLSHNIAQKMDSANTAMHQSIENFEQISDSMQQVNATLSKGINDIEQSISSVKTVMNEIINRINVLNKNADSYHTDNTKSLRNLQADMEKKYTDSINMMEDRIADLQQNEIKSQKYIKVITGIASIQFLLFCLLLFAIYWLGYFDWRLL